MQEQERMKRGGKERATPTFLMKIAIPAYSNEVTINRMIGHTHHTCNGKTKKLS